MHANHDLLFASTAIELRFVTTEQVREATERPTDGQPLSRVLVARGALSAGDAEAVERVIKRRLAHGGEDATRALRLAGVDAAATPGSITPPDLLGAAAAGCGGAHDTLATPDASGDPFRTATAPAAGPALSASRYKVLRVHQEGGLGRVSVAADGDFGREIALKEILPGRADDPEHRQRFLREAEITGALEHPGVVPVYSLGEHADGRPYYAMRFIRGVDLQQAIADFYDSSPIAERPLRFRRLLARFVDVCQTIDYAHSRGVLHRDLKPSNIMLGDYGETLVVDWGLAKASGQSGGNGGSASDGLHAPPVSPSGRSAADATHAGRVVGTPAYMSPEQAEGRIDLLTPATDIYGLGATLYHLLTGAAPIDGGDLRVLADARRGRFPRPGDRRDGVPRPLEAICLRAMARRPEGRYPTAGSVALEVERYLADEPVEAYPEPLTARVGRWARNHRGVVLSAASAATVAIVMLIVSVALLTASNRRERSARAAANASAAEADRQRRAAENSSALARQAVRDYYVTVSEETLLGERGMHPLRDRLLRQALDYYRLFVEQRAGEATLLTEVALAHYYTGEITETIDSPAEALPHYEQAIELQRRLAIDAAGPLRSAELARSINARGRACQKLGRLVAAADAFAEASALRRKISSGGGDADDDAIREWANSMMNLAVVRLQQGEPDAALVGLRRAQALRRTRLTTDSPELSPLRRDAARGDYNLAVALLQLGRPSDSLAALRRATATFQRIADAAPRDADNRARLANALRMIAVVKQSTGDAEAAVAAYRSAAETLRPLVDRNPEVVDYAADWAGVRMNLAEQLAAAGDSDGAVREIAAAVQTLQTVRAELTPRQRCDLGVALRFWGETHAAAGQPGRALERLRQSREVLAGLVREQPSVAKHLDELAATDAAIALLSDEGGGPL